MSSEPRCLPCRGRVSFMVAVLRRIWGVEARGGRFRRLDADHLTVEPADVLTDDDRGFLREHRDEVWRVLDYCLNEGWRR
jgi:hypothetical protein